MASLRTPIATYRLQFNREFGFREARELLPYLDGLGITDVYASPLLQSRQGSGHGYDVTDSTRLDTDPGSEADFEAFQAELAQRGMGLILDIVPNHMAAGKENPWWMDVLENGSSSAYASHFDIDWHPSSLLLNNKVLLPVLGRSYGQALESQELRLVYEGGSFSIRYHDEVFPLAPKSYRLVLKHRLDVLERRLGVSSAALQEYREILASLAALPERESLPVEAAGERRLQAEAIKTRLRRLYDTEPGVQKFIRENLRWFCGKKGEAASFRLLDRLLAEQAYVLAYWQNPNEVINYRRFFTISDLVGVRVEDPFVFEATHGVILRLVEKGTVTGLRIDHVDGLRDPFGYLQRLQERVARPPDGDPRGFYIVVEKILADSEKLPPEWPIHGTTGYDFLNAVNGVFVDPQGAGTVERIYSRFLNKQVAFKDVLYQKKKLVMGTLLAVEMRSLSRQLGILAEQDRYARDLPRAELGQVLIETTACLSVYRTYVRSLEVPDEARRYIESAVEEARRRRSNLSAACFDFVREVLLLQDSPHLFPEQKESRLTFVMRWQQFTGPIVAKGLEDTTLYVYNPLISLNEVGGDPRPSEAPIRDFHQFVQERGCQWPYTFNATATHDSKRAEDVRARINVLSEIPEQWRSHLNRWSQWNLPIKKTVKGELVPDRNEEIFLYQTLLGAWPLDPEDTPRLKVRLRDYVIKATREAMVHTRWTQPNLEHEQALTEFFNLVLDCGKNARFVNDFRRFQGKIAYYGMLNGLAQVLLKIACPGVPDFYQGSELWDLRLVDPDNRGPVDFKKRSALLAANQSLRGNPTPDFVRELDRHWSDGRIKLYLIWKALNFRREHAQLFLHGDYTALKGHGPRKDNALAFTRSARDHWVIAAVPRWLARTNSSGVSAARDRLWGTSYLTLPDGAPARWVNVLTGREVICGKKAGRKAVPLQSLFADFPVALLFAGRSTLVHKARRRASR